MAKLQPDYINWTLSLNTSQVQEAYHNLEKENKELQKQTNTSRKLMAQLAADRQQGSEQWNNLSKTIAENSKKMSENNAKMSQLMKQAKPLDMTVNQLNNHLKKLKLEFNSTAKATNPSRYEELKQEIDRTKQAIYKATGETDKLKNGFISLTKIKQTCIGFFSAIGAGILTNIVGAFTSAFNIVVSFEKENSRLAAILGTTQSGIKDLTAEARRLGATTSYTAAEVTGLQIELAKLGFNKEQIKNMEAPVLKFAKAVGTDLSSASAFAGAALRIFGKDAKDTEDVLATCAIATTKTALDFSKLETSLSVVGPVANSFGLTIQDTVALLGQLANAGFDATSAATATRNIILNLCDANGDLAKALGGPVTTLDDLQKGLQKLNAEGIDLAKALDLTDKRSVAAFSSFLQGADSLTTLRNSISGVNKDFNKMSDTMADNVAGSLAALQSASESLILKIAEGKTGPIKALIDALTEIVKGVVEVIDFLGKFSTAIKGLTVAFLTYKATIVTVIALQKSYLAGAKACHIIADLWKSKTLILGTAISTLSKQIKTATSSWKSFKAAMLSSGIGIAIAAIGAVVSALYTWCSANEDVEESIDEVSEAESRMAAQAKAHADKRNELTSQLSAEKTKLLDLVKVAEDENASNTRRQKAIEQLNKLCPEYNGYLDKERGLLKANKKALDEYIQSMEQRMRIAYYKDEYQQYINEQEAAKTRFANAKREYNAHKDEVVKSPTLNKDKINNADLYDSPDKPYLKKRSEDALDKYVLALNAANDELTTATNNLENFKSVMDENGVNVEDVFDDATNSANNTAESVSGIATAAHGVVDEVKSLTQQLKELRKIDPQTDEEYADIEKKKKSIQARLKELKGTSTKKSKHEKGTYSEGDLDQVTDPVDDTHQKNLLALNKQKYDLSQEEYALKKAQEMVRYCDELTEALETLRASTDSTKTETLANITAEENKIAAQRQASEQEINAAMLKQRQKFYADQLTAQQVAYDSQKQVMEAAVRDDEITQEAADVYLLQEHKNTLNSQLKSLQDYYAEIKNSTTIGEAQRVAILGDITKQMHDKQTAILTDTGKWSEKLRELMTNTTSRAGIIDSFTTQRQGIEQVYNAAIKIVGEGTEEAVALENEKQKRIAALNFQQQEQMYQLQEITGVSWANEYDRELAQLENYHTQGMISEEAYQKKKLELQIDNVKKYYDYYTNLSSSMFTAIQDAEIAASDAKYDVLIRQAENNGEDTTELEEEKENAKLEIQKKYADVNFAIKVSQIIADTAVSIMKAYADLGPIAGSVAAAMLTATGAAQVASAKAERDKIKNLQPSSTSSSTDTTATAERVLSSGYAEGGYTGDGDRYEVAGVVHKGEYVVPKPIMNNPRVVDAVGTIEAIRRNRLRGTADAGNNSYAEGGFTGTAATKSTELAAAVKDMKAAIQSISVIKAYVSYRDIEKAGDNLSKARAPFTRNK